MGEEQKNEIFNEEKVIDINEKINDVATDEKTVTGVNGIYANKVVLNKKMENLTEAINEIDKVNKKVIKDNEEDPDKSDEIYSIIEERIKGYTLDQIDNLTIDEVKELFTIDGELIEFEGDFSKTDKNVFMKDLAKYLKETQINKEGLDKLMQEYQEEMKSFNEELEKIMGDFEDLPSMYRAELRDRVENEENEDRKKILGDMNKMFDYAFSLENVISFYNEIGTKNTLREYQNENLRKNIIEKYNRKVKEIGLRVSIAAFNNFETKFLDESYHERNNLFIFSIMKYIANKSNLKRRSPEVQFIVYFGVVMQSLYAESISPKNKETILNSAKNLLALF
nr:MAG TPA: hypothetical protein [Caudoviricetes sp.]